MTPGASPRRSCCARATVSTATTVYQSIATQIAQQPPLSTTASLARDEQTPLTLAHGFPIAPGVVHNTFAVDPDFRAGLAHNW
jgi:hypothetical protein